MNVKEHDDMMNVKFPPARSEGMLGAMNMISQPTPPAFAQVDGQFHAMRDEKDNIKAALAHSVTHEAHIAIDKILDDLENSSVDSAVLAEQLRTVRKANADLRQRFDKALHANDSLKSDNVVMHKANETLSKQLHEVHRSLQFQELVKLRAENDEQENTIFQLVQRNTNQQRTVQDLQSKLDFDNGVLEAQRTEIGRLKERVDNQARTINSGDAARDLRAALAMATNQNAHDAETLRQLRAENIFLRETLKRKLPFHAMQCCTDQSIIDRRDSRPVGTAYDVVGPSC